MSPVTSGDAGIITRHAIATGFILPVIIADAGDHAARRFLEFFTATIRNRHTRSAYTRAVGNFLAWCGCRLA